MNIWYRPKYIIVFKLHFEKDLEKNVTMGKQYMGSGVRMPQFEFQLYRLQLSNLRWERCVTFLRLIFLIHKMGTIFTSRDCCED